MPDISCITTIDWPATGSMLQGAGSVLGPVAVGIAAWIGGNTFKAWRKQKLAERHIEQAERILTATYKVRRDLAYVRQPMMLPHEFEAAEQSLKDAGQWDQVFPESQRKKLTTAQAYYNRLNRTKDDQRALEECQPMARALFGEELEKAIEKLNHLFWTVQVYVDADYRDNTHTDPAHRKKIESTIWEGWPSAAENEVDQIIAAQVKIIEETCVPVLRLETKG